MCSVTVSTICKLFISFQRTTIDHNFIIRHSCCRWENPLASVAYPPVLPPAGPTPYPGGCASSCDSGSARIPDCWRAAVQWWIRRRALRQCPWPVGPWGCGRSCRPRPSQSQSGGGCCCLKMCFFLQLVVIWKCSMYGDGVISTKWKVKSYGMVLQPSWQSARIVFLQGNIVTQVIWVIHL